MPGAPTKQAAATAPVLRARCVVQPSTRQRPARQRKTRCATPRLAQTATAPAPTTRAQVAMPICHNTRTSQTRWTPPAAIKCPPRPGRLGAVSVFHSEIRRVLRARGALRALRARIRHGT
jgi:hypothetical protein